MLCGRYKAEYFTSICSFFIISFQRLAVKDPPESDDTTDGIPKKASHPWRNAVAAADAVASGKGIQWTNLVVLHIAVSKNFIP